MLSSLAGTQQAGHSPFLVFTSPPLLFPSLPFVSDRLWNKWHPVPRAATATAPQGHPAPRSAEQGGDAAQGLLSPLLSLPGVKMAGSWRPRGEGGHVSPPAEHGPSRVRPGDAPRAWPCLSHVHCGPVHRERFAWVCWAPRARAGRQATVTSFSCFMSVQRMPRAPRPGSQIRRPVVTCCDGS